MDVHAAKLNKDGLGNEQRRKEYMNLKRLETVALWALSVEMLYLALRAEYFLENMKSRLGADLE